MKFARWIWVGGILVAGIALVLLSVGATHPALARSLAAPESYLYRFDPATDSFFTFTLPAGSAPQGVAVTGTSPVTIWVAEYGRNAIGRLVYTSTSDTSWNEYLIGAPDSGPSQLAISGDDVWFTERNADRVGRLNVVTGQIDEFYGHGLTAGAGLADIQVSPNGWIWTVGQKSNRIIKLVVTSTVDYSFEEYSDPLVIGPRGLSIDPLDNYIWVAAPAGHKVARLTPSTGAVLLATIPANSVPYDIVSTPTSGYVWFTDAHRDAVGQLEIGTLTNLNLYTSVSRPAALAAGGPGRLWIAQQDNQGGLARFVYTSTTNTSFQSYPLPVSGLLPGGIAVSGDQGVWLAAAPVTRLYLPVIMR